MLNMSDGNVVPNKPIKKKLIVEDTSDDDSIDVEAEVLKPKLKRHYEMTPARASHIEKLKKLNAENVGKKKPVISKKEKAIIDIMEKRAKESVAKVEQLPPPPVPVVEPVIKKERKPRVKKEKEVVAKIEQLPPVQLPVKKSFVFI